MKTVNFPDLMSELENGTTLAAIILSALTDLSRRYSFGVFGSIPDSYGLDSGRNG